MHKITIIFLVLVSLKLTGQQSEQFSLYFMDPYTSNPAYGGLDGSLSLSAAIRQQWTGLSGRPTTQLVQGHMPLYRLQGAAGVQVVNEQIGNGGITHFAASYNYVRPMKSVLWSVGLAAGISARRFDGSAWRAPDGIYDGGNIDHQDPSLSDAAVNGTAPFVGIGAYVIWNGIEGGVALRQVIAPEIKLDPLGSFGMERWMQLQFSYRWEFYENLSLRPSFQLKSDFVQWQSDLNVVISYNGKLFGGMSFRGYSASTFNALVFIGGLKLNDHYELAYAFDQPIGPLRSVAGGSHELMLRYNLNKRIGGGGIPRIIYNPRFL